MSFEWILVVVFVLVAFGLVVYLYDKAAGVWRYVKASRLKTNLAEFLFHYAEMSIRKMPASLIYHQMVSAKKGGAIISLQVQKDFYKLIDRTVSLALHEFNKDNQEGELKLRRIGGFYILSGSIADLIEKIIESVEAEKELLLKGDEESVAEKAKLAYLTTQLKAYKNSVSKALKDSLTKDKDDKQNVDEATVLEERDRLFEKVFLFYAVDLQTELRGNRIFMSKEDNVRLFKYQLFENSSNALIKAQQTGLNIRFVDLEVYFGLNGDIEKTVDILLKARHLGFKIELEDLEKFIVAGGDIHTTLKHLIDAKNAGLELKLEELEKYLLLGGNISEVVKALIRAHQEGIKGLTIKYLSEYLSQGGNVNDIVNAIIKLGQEKIDIPLVELNSFRAAGGNINELTLGLIKAKHSGIEIKMANLRSYLAQGGDINKLITVLIKTQSADIDLSIADYERLSRIGADIMKVFVSFKIAKRAKINIPKEKLIEIQVAGGDMFAFIKVLSLAKRLKLEISEEELEADVIDSRDVLKVTFAVIYARKEGIMLDYKKAIRFDREGHDVAKVVAWAVNPQVISVEPKAVLSKDGISMRLFANVSVRGKIDMYLRGSREEVMADRINEAIVKEVEFLESYHEVLKNLNKIAFKVFRRVTGTMEAEDFPELDKEELAETNEKEIKVNAGTAYEIIDVNIPSLVIGEDAYAEIKKEHAEVNKIIAETESEQRIAQAEAQKLEAKAKLIEAEAKLQEGMAHAFKEGHMNTKEYHKKIIFDESEDLFEKTKHRKGH